MKKKEKLDYCRVKKIFDKGFGFLTSLYYDENVFFHFSGIKDKTVKEKLENLKRGEVYFYYTSYLYEGKRKVYKLWLDIADVEPELIPEFENRITKEFILGKTNPFEVAYVIKQLRENGFMSSENFNKIIVSPKLLKTPSILLAMLTETELKKKSLFEEIISQLESSEIDKTEWVKKIPVQFSTGT